MNYRDFLNRLNDDGLCKNIIIHGDERYHFDEALARIIKKCTNESFREFNVVKIENINDSEDNFSRLIESVSTVPLMSSKKIVIVGNADFLTSKSSFKFDNLKLENLLNRVDEDTYLIFLIKKGKPDLRKKMVKEFKKNNSIYKFDRLDRGELHRYIAVLFASKKIKISSADVEYIADNSGYLDYEATTTLYDINNELRKLVSFSFESKMINRNNIDSLMHKSLSTNIFNLVDSVCNSNKKMAYELLQDMLLSGANEQYIIYMIYRQYRIMLNYKILDEKRYSYKDILKEMKTKDFILKKTVRASRTLNSEDIIRKLMQITDIDRKIKSGKVTATYGIEILCSML